MKRILTFALIAVMVAAAAPAYAESVNLGLVTMEKAELERLQGLMNRSQSLADGTPAAVKPAAVDLGLVKMDADEVASLEALVSGEAEFVAHSDNAPRAHLAGVDLTGMDEADLQAIKHLVHERYKNGPPLLKKMHLATNE